MTKEITMGDMLKMALEEARKSSDENKAWNWWHNEGRFYRENQGTKK